MLTLACPPMLFAAILGGSTANTAPLAEKTQITKERDSFVDQSKNTTNTEKGNNTETPVLETPNSDVVIFASLEVEDTAKKARVKCRR